jgi:hypothetical protein
MNNNNDYQRPNFPPDTIKKAMLLWEATQNLCDSFWDIFDEDFISLDEMMRQNPSQQIISDIDDPFPF